MQNSKDDADRLSEQPAPYGKSKTLPLAPDGLPWPEGYFDRTPVLTLEEAIARFGVRPSCYRHGRPVYTPADRENPNYVFPYPSEPEWVAELEAEADRREKSEGK